jgi:hypothetical protein
LDKFVCVRVVQANNMDLATYQFDYGLTWSVVFLNADKTIYGRYGSRCQAQGSKDVTLEGFKKAAEGALELHKGYPGNKSSLAGKTGPKPHFPIPQAYPSLKTYSAAVTPGEKRNNPTCMHCHEIEVGEYKLSREAKQPIPDTLLWAYPMPDTLGLTLDLSEKATVQSVAPGSSAEKDGWKPGHEIVTLEGQPILSIADVQWVLQHAKEGAKLRADVKGPDGAKTLSLTLTPEFRRRGEFWWRAATWGSFRPDMSGEVLSPEERKGLNLPDGATAIRIKYAGKGLTAHGFQRDDIIVEVDGQKTGLDTFSKFLAFVAQKKMPGDSMAITVLRGGVEQKLRLPAR